MLAIQRANVFEGKPRPASVLVRHSIARSARAKAVGGSINGKPLKGIQSLEGVLKFVTLSSTNSAHPELVVASHQFISRCGVKSRSCSRHSTTCHAMYHTIPHHVFQSQHAIYYHVYMFISVCIGLCVYVCVCVCARM